MFAKEKKPVVEAPVATATEVPEFPKQRANGSGSTRGYTVEARFMFNDGASEVFNGVPLGPKWRTLHFPESPIGVPKGDVGFGHLPGTSLLPYESAQALRWWFLANVNVSHPGGTLCLETRLVKHDCKYSFEEVAVGAEEAADR